MEMKGLMGGFYRISEWIMRFAVTNLLWIICSIPFVFFVTSPFFNMDKVPLEQDGSAFLLSLAFLFIPAALVAPFTFFPATAAMFTVARKWVMGEGDVPLLKTFFRGYKSNYLQSMCGGLFFELAFVVFMGNLYFYKGISGFGHVIYYVFIVMLVFMLISLFNFFSMQSHFHMKFWTVVKNAILFTIGRPLTSLLILVTNAVILYICFTKLHFFLVFFFMGSLVAYMSFWHFYRVLSKLMDKGLAGSEEDDESSDSNSEQA